jgi:SAM-dependent methyltransferase/beta-galactosidase beta subunit
MKFDFIFFAHEKDFLTLKISINYIKRNISSLNRIFVVSKKDPSIEGSVYISEERYSDHVDIVKIYDRFKLNQSKFSYRCGWIYQQILKLLSAQVIPELTDSYVVVDSDTIFLNDVSFSEEKFYYCKANEYHQPYIETIKKILGVDSTIGFSTISHHMIFNKKYLNEMIQDIQNRFESNSLCDCILDNINYDELSSVSEWDLYSNYMITNHPEISENRQLIWKDISYIPNDSDLEDLRIDNDFISCHEYLRPNNNLNNTKTMSNYIHCYIGEIPSFLIDSFRSIYHVEPQARLILITDQHIEIDGIDVFHIDDVVSEQTSKVLNMNLFSDKDNKLWRTSIFRVFLVRDCMKKLRLKNCYHFDSDVLLFEPSSKFEHLINDFDGLSITYHTEDEVVFGFSKFGIIQKIDVICDILFEIIFDEEKQKEYSVGMPNEMQLLGGIYKRRPDLIKRIDILPNESGIVFDPSSYGQYFGGTDNGHPSGWYGEHHVIGKKISEGSLVPILLDHKPYVVMDGNRYAIANLHIHSKNTERFTFHIDSDIDLNIEKTYPGSEMLPYERYKLYKWVSEIIKPNSVLDVGCGIGGATYYISEAMKKCGSTGKIYSCDPGRSPTTQFFMRQSNVDYRAMYSDELIEHLILDNIKLDYIFFDGPEDPDVALHDINLLEDWIDPGCYFSMHDWETEPRKYDGQQSIKSLKIRSYIESNPNIWEPIEVLDGINSYDSVGFCLYKFLGK